MAALAPSESQPLLDGGDAPRGLAVAASGLSYAAPASRGRPGALLLRDVTLVVPRRGVLPVMGPSGSGKSTLLEDCADLLDGGLTARETLDFAAALRMLGARTAARAAQVDRVLDALELSRCARRAAPCSGGELRRVSIGEELPPYGAFEPLAGRPLADVLLLRGGEVYQGPASRAGAVARRRPAPGDAPTARTPGSRACATTPSPAAPSRPSARRRRRRPSPRPSPRSRAPAAPPRAAAPAARHWRRLAAVVARYALSTLRRRHQLGVQLAQFALVGVLYGALNLGTGGDEGDYDAYWDLCKLIFFVQLVGAVGTGPTLVPTFVRNIDLLRRGARRAPCRAGPLRRVRSQYSLRGFDALGPDARRLLMSVWYGRWTFEAWVIAQFGHGWGGYSRSAALDRRLPARRRRGRSRTRRSASPSSAPPASWRWAGRRGASSPGCPGNALDATAPAASRRRAGAPARPRPRRGRRRGPATPARRASTSSSGPSSTASPAARRSWTARRARRRASSAIMGGSGAGKTTLLAAVAGRLRGDTAGGGATEWRRAGAVRFSGARRAAGRRARRPRARPSRSARSTATATSGLTVGETLRFSARLRGAGPGAAADALARLRLGHRECGRRGVLRRRAAPRRPRHGARRRAARPPRRRADERPRGRRGRRRRAPRRTRPPSRGPDRASRRSSSVASTSIRPTFGRIDRAPRALEAPPKR
ncbi:hypothetical protein JL722_2716 [Aureococcus anophagefferens]|nr:hypothetical protein JL722_2716 [Aureococcus anophagefferens]